MMLQGEITVAFRNEGTHWQCIALQFDIVGVGPTRYAAFAELQALVEDYLEEAIDSDEPISFFNPASAEDWNTPDQESFGVSIVFSSIQVQPMRPALSNIKSLHTYREAIEHICLTPNCA
jgi:hypothetical protein